MRKTFITIAAAAVLASSGAWAGKHHHPMTEAEEENCLMTDTNEAGEIWCVKSSVGMSEKEINAFFLREAEKGAALNKKATEVSYINCKKGMENYQTLGEWIGPPSAEDCKAMGVAPQVANDAGNARLHHALNEEIMKQCNRMVDTPGIDWKAVATLRGVTVTLDDCVNASKGLAAEFSK